MKYFLHLLFLISFWFTPFIVNATEITFSNIWNSEILNTLDNSPLYFAYDDSYRNWDYYMNFYIRDITDWSNIKSTQTTIKENRFDIFNWVYNIWNWKYFISSARWTIGWGNVQYHTQYITIYDSLSNTFSIPNDDWGLASSNDSDFNELNISIGVDNNGDYIMFNEDGFCYNYNLSNMTCDMSNINLAWSTYIDLKNTIQLFWYQEKLYYLNNIGDISYMAFDSSNNISFTGDIILDLSYIADKFNLSPISYDISNNIFYFLVSSSLWDTFIYSYNFANNELILSDTDTWKYYIKSSSWSFDVLDSNDLSIVNSTNYTTKTAKIFSFFDTGWIERVWYYLDNTSKWVYDTDLIFSNISFSELLNNLSSPTTDNGSWFVSNILNLFTWNTDTNDFGSWTTLITDKASELYDYEVDETSTTFEFIYYAPTGQNLAFEPQTVSLPLVYNHNWLIGLSQRFNWDSTFAYVLSYVFWLMYIFGILFFISLIFLPAILLTYVAKNMIFTLSWGTLFVDESNHGNLASFGVWVVYIILFFLIFSTLSSAIWLIDYFLYFKDWLFAILSYTFTFMFHLPTNELLVNAINYMSNAISLIVSALVLLKLVNKYGHLT